MNVHHFAMFTLVLGLAMSATAQVKTEVPPPVPGAKPVTVEHIKVHGTSLEGNLEGDDVDRDVIVFCPPAMRPTGIGGIRSSMPCTATRSARSSGLRRSTFRRPSKVAFAQGAQEMIVVLPDSKTVHNGSMYSSSVTTGDFEQFIAHDRGRLYRRALPHDSRATSRGLVGHSMGGYGASRIGMKHPDVFGSLYIMSPCCLSARGRPARRTGRRKSSGSGQDASRFASLPSACAPSLPPPPRGRPIRRIRRCTSICRSRTAWCGRISSRNGRPMHPWRLSTSTSATCGSIGPSRSTWATRTACASTPASCTTCSTPTASPTRLRFIRHPHQRRRRPLPEPRDAVLRQESVLRKKLQVSGRTATKRGRRRRRG